MTRTNNREPTPPSEKPEDYPMKLIRRLEAERGQARRERDEASAALDDAAMALLVRGSRLATYEDALRTLRDEERDGTWAADVIDAALAETSVEGEGPTASQSARIAEPLASPSTPSRCPTCASDDPGERNDVDFTTEPVFCTDPWHTKTIEGEP